MSTGILKARFAVMRDVETLSKTRKNKHHDYYYSGHDDVTDALRPAFNEHGILQTVSVVESTRDESGLLRVKVLIRWTCVEDDSFHEVFSLGEVDGKGRAVQAGQAVSYAVKVAQLKNFMLDGGAPDPEATHGDERADKRGSDRPVPVAPKVEVADQQVDLLLDQYKEITNKLELSNLRRSISSLVSGLTDVQHAKLEEADHEAQARVSGR